MFQRCLESTQTTSSQNHLLKKPNYARLQLASVLIETGRDPQKCGVFNDLITMHEKDKGSIDFILVSSAFRLRGELNRKRGRWDSSLKDLETALNLVEEFRVTAIPGIMNRRVNETYAKIMNSIGLVYEQT